VPAVTPAEVAHAFAAHGIEVARVPEPPKLCDVKACRSLSITGGTFVCFAPKQTVDFFVALLPTAADAQRVGKVGRSGGLGAVARGSTLLLYLKSSTRVGRLLAALASLDGGVP
jgi:hypothetical protein